MQVRAVAAATALAAAAWGASSASAQPDFVEFAGTVSDTQRTFTWTGTTFVGANAGYADAEAGCGELPSDYCDEVLVAVDVPPADGFSRRRSTVTVDIGSYTLPVSDYDVYLFASDAEGTKGAPLGNSAGLPGEAESASGVVTTTLDKPVAYVLAEIVYYVAAGSYEGTAKVVPGASSVPVPAPAPTATATSPAA